MSDEPRETRSFEVIRPEDLERLAEIGKQAVAHACRPALQSRIYRDQLLLLCFCQGAALQYRQQEAGVPLEQQQGINDFDVWAFFREHPRMPFPWRTRREFDFGSPRFGLSPDGKRRTGRKVDFLGRSIPVGDQESAIDAVLAWVQKPGGEGDSPYELRQRPIYVISPGLDFGRMIWGGDAWAHG